MFKFERWMDFLAEDLKPKERAARKRWVKQIRKLCTRCIVKSCGALLLDKDRRLRATNQVVKAVCRSCRENHKPWYRWFRGKYARTYFTNGNYLLKREINFGGFECLNVCGKIYDASGKPPMVLAQMHWTSGEMLDGSQVPEGVRGPNLVDLFDRPMVPEPTPTITGWERGDVEHRGRNGLRRIERRKDQAAFKIKTTQSN